MADITSTSVPIDNSIELDELIMAIANQDQKALQVLYCQYRRSIFYGCLCRNTRSSAF